jgi:SAM-dependent methyltransferase
MVFENYAKYYDLLYKDKDYKKEIDYIDSLIKKHSKKDNISVLDLGCGTGIHANYLSEKGYTVTGIDFSEDMIAIANQKKKPNTEFFVFDATDFKLGKKYDIILSLFHVVSYQTTNRNVDSLFRNVYEHLEENGIFIFDFWYGPAVLSEVPSVKIKRLEDDDIKIIRIAEPVMHVNNNVVDVNYDLVITNKLNNQTENVKEMHKMRYFFIPEIELFLSKSNLNAIKCEEWITGVIPSSHTWGVCCIVEGKK